MAPCKTLFLPGAGGSASFWQTVATALQQRGVIDEAVLLSWPGLGDEPADPRIAGLDDLVALVAGHMQQPVNIVAQSMGGVIAIRLALAMPDLVNRLVLTVTSGGVPVADLGGEDWRPEYFAAFPQAARWIADPVEDLSDRMAELSIPTLLLWGDKDRISPPVVGQRLRQMLMNSTLHVLPDAGHDLAVTHSSQVVALIAEHFSL
ncbi:alpha/beta fold hydrolase [Insolitispirillum peregrinum]|uniref:Alpha/beta hydrolase family protein n=1 Tax=Insolitispirillum peregrinum TaxID=80876 RepID=A0A1N7IYR4_9PROT|nr:alpha/beta hydrolase [Insolitispirillum peregrinum]SIS42262.1 Alpha/beta hydrolase family protein [Insolitispirillum peregrinum]